MDLDKLKKSWGELDKRPVIQQEEIIKMLRQRRKSAFDRLLRSETVATYACPILIPISLLISNTMISIICLFSVVIGICWQVYKCIFLRKTDILNMDLVELSERISKYKLYIYREFIVALTWCFLLTLLFFSYDLFFEREKTGFYFAFLCIWNLVLVPCVAWFIYRMFFVKNIKKVQDAICEAKEYEAGNKK